MLSVHDLRKLGHKVRVNHCRYQDSNGNVRPRGGKTFVTVTFNGETVNGFADCSRVDNYNKKLGVRIALGRALKQLNLRTK